MDADSISKVAVLGLGTMGHGIAQVFATGGLNVGCYDEVAAARESTLDRVRANFEQMREARVITDDAADAAVSRITVHSSEAEAVAGAKFVVEAVREDLPTKQDLFKRLESLVFPETILASNTSTFPMSQMAQGMNHPERAVNTHWFNPAHLTPLVEIIPGESTAPQTTDFALRLHERVGKVAVRINKEVPGHLVNRFQSAMMREVWWMLEQGVASAEDIDRAVVASIGFRLAAIGPMQVCDFAGLDIWRRVHSELVKDIHSGTEIPKLVTELTDAGHLGVKTGHGLFEYTPESADEKRRERDRRFLAILKLFHMPDSALSDKP
jgi:3-hydroxybutyryl-CoA dehydrogenase